MAWLKESARLSETNQWDNDKRCEMLTDNLEGEAKEWFTKNKDNMKNFDQLKEGLINQYKDTKELILQRLIHTTMKESESMDTYANRFSEAVEKYLNFCQKEGSEQDLSLKDILLNMVNNISPLTTKHAVLPLSSEIDRVIGQEKDMNSVSSEKFEDIVTSVINFALANEPVNIVKEIASTPPSQEFSDAFFKLCVVGACSGMVTMKLYKYDNYRQELFYDSLDEYLQNNLNLLL
ncbi:hypothetical protein INT47_009021 [Mucor saturninus]|uniref:Retrotransposon gag domain-containing protein n=1 Tax=Mucor saturninus TaxID=64648 RepID=A0A8H7V1W0_9FUNG|nr:hypothetical protein INT47_009021 [Mucor saturninus]